MLKFQLHGVSIYSYKADGYPAILYKQNWHYTPAEEPCDGLTDRISRLYVNEA